MSSHTLPPVPFMASLSHAPLPRQSVPNRVMCCILYNAIVIHAWYIYIECQLIKRAHISLKGTTEYGPDRDQNIYSHIFACQSPLPVASKPPPGLRAIEITELRCPRSKHCAVPVRSQNITPRSFDPDTSHCPSGDTRTERTKS